MDDKQFEESLNEEKTIIKSFKNHTEEFEKELDNNKNEYEVRHEEELETQRLIKLSEEPYESTETSSFSGIQSFIVSIVTVAIVLAVGLIVLNEVGDSLNAQQYNSSMPKNGLVSKLAGVSSWVGIIIIVALAFVVLSFFVQREY